MRIDFYLLTKFLCLVVLPRAEFLREPAPTDLAHAHWPFTCGLSSSVLWYSHVVNSWVNLLPPVLRMRNQFIPVK
jgi:hypothetical protein